MAKRERCCLDCGFLADDALPENKCPRCAGSDEPQPPGIELTEWEVSCNKPTAGRDVCGAPVKVSDIQTAPDGLLRCVCGADWYLETDTTREIIPEGVKFPFPCWTQLMCEPITVKLEPVEA